MWSKPEVSAYLAEAVAAFDSLFSIQSTDHSIPRCVPSQIIPLILNYSLRLPGALHIKHRILSRATGQWRFGRFSVLRSRSKREHEQMALTVISDFPVAVSPLLRCDSNIDS